MKHTNKAGGSTAVVNGSNGSGSYDSVAHTNKAGGETIVGTRTKSVNRYTNKTTDIGHTNIVGGSAWTVKSSSPY